MGSAGNEWNIIIIFGFALLFLLGVSSIIVVTTRHMAVNDKGQIIEYVEDEVGEKQEVMLTTEEGEVLKKSAKEPFHFNIKAILFVIYTNWVAITFIFLAFIFGSVGLTRYTYHRKDKMHVFESMGEYFDTCQVQGLKSSDVKGYVRGDGVVLFNDTPNISLYDYLFKSSATALKASAFALRYGKEYKLEGKAESSGMYYKVGKYYIPKEKLYIQENEHVNMLAYVKDKDIYKVSDCYILKDFLVLR